MIVNDAQTPEEQFEIAKEHIEVWSKIVKDQQTNLKGSIAALTRWEDLARELSVRV